MKREYGVRFPNQPAPDPKPRQALGFAEWLMRVEDQLGFVTHSRHAARLYNQGVAVMDAVLQLREL